jgi:hypothetical protein
LLLTDFEEFKIPHWYYKHWRKTVTNVNKILSSKTVVPFTILGDGHRIHFGHPSEPVPIECDLMHSVFQLMEQGLQVNTHTLRNEAARLPQNFKDKSTKAKISTMHCFIQEVGLSHRVSSSCCKEGPHGDRGRVISFHISVDADGFGDGDGWYQQYGSNPDPLFFSLQLHF